MANTRRPALPAQGEVQASGEGVPEHAIFYSWQSDLRSATNRTLIENALEIAVATLGQARIEPADAARDGDAGAGTFSAGIDSDTRGVPGSPNIADTILEKIARAAAFVADVSIVNPNRAGDERPTPNPNVLVEVGYAAHALGWDQVILVINLAYGPIEQLPFDLRPRRIIRYTMPEAQPDRAGGRRALARDLEAALRPILAGVQAEQAASRPTPGDVARAAIEAGRPDADARCRDYMTWLVGEIAARAPTFDGDGRHGDEWDEQLWAAIGASPPLVVEFTRVATTAADHQHRAALTALHDGFEALLEHYWTPAGSRMSRECDGDFARFIGHELFVSLVAPLVHARRWEMLADLLDRDFAVTNDWGKSSARLGFGRLSLGVALLEHRRERQKINIVRLHSLVLQERHERGALADLLPWQRFMEADYLLFLRGLLGGEDHGYRFIWCPWSTLYLRQPPKFLERAVSKREAERLLPVLNVPNVEALRERLATRAPRLRDLFPNGMWDHPLDMWDVASIASR